ncbi:MAG: hypothetical protein IJ313_07900 [Clostridia bacterium]|nr:hypothetical protein [Clostridia bacterium]
MKKICLLLMIVLLLSSACALAQGTGGSSAAKKEFDIYDVDFDNLSKEEKDLIEKYKEEARQDRLKKLRDAYEPKPKDYDQNTVCSFGPQFREVSPRMTDEWYMFTPVDLSEEGTQTFDLIAGNMFVIGEVSVTVENGKFQVDYEYNSAHIEIGREYFNIYPDYESIEAGNLENLHAQKRFSYGKAYSIEDKLDGDTDVILFVCNTATFQKTTGGVGEYYSTHPARVAEREKLLDMIGE